MKAGAREKLSVQGKLHPNIQVNRLSLLTQILRNAHFLRAPHLQRR